MVLSSILDGVKRVVSAPALLMGVFAVTIALALPLALTLRGMLGEHLGSSLAAAEAADAVNYDWWREFEAQAAGLGTSFTPSVVGFAAVLDNMSSLLDKERQIAPVAGALAAYLLAWTFLAGGIVDRLARRRPTRTHGFFAASGVFFFRFLRLGVLAAVVYGFLYVYVHEWIFDRWFRAATQDLAAERAVFFWRLAMYAVFGLLLLFANLLFDYAKIRAVVEDRRSMIVALLASARFVVHNPARVMGLYLANATVFLALIAVWALVAPGAGAAGLSMWTGFLIAQAYLLARLFLKLQFIASQTSLFQASLAHAGYTAAPAPVWPESPSAEAIRAGG